MGGVQGVGGVRVRGGRGGGGWLELVTGPRGRPRGGGLLGGAALGGRRRGGLVELDGDVAGDLRGTATPLGRGPGVWVEELAAVVAALGQAGAV